MRTYNITCHVCGQPLPEPTYRLSKRNIEQRTCRACKAEQCRRDGKTLMLRNNAIPVTEDMKQVIIGSILGDGHLEKPPKGSINWGLLIKHSMKQEHYARFKASLLHPLVSKVTTCPPKQKPVVIQGRTTVDNGRIKVRTVRHEYLTGLASLFVPAGHKIVPASIAAILGPLALAIWHLDDGCYTAPFQTKKGYWKKAQIRLSSFGFSTEGNELLRSALKTNFGLESVPFYAKRRKYEGIALHGDQAEHFLDIVTPLIQGSGLERKGRML